MLPALAAATAAIDALQALTAAKKKTAATSGATQPKPNPFDVPAATTASTATAPTVINSATKSSGTLSSGTMSAMLDAQSQSATTGSTKRADALKSLFGQLDGDASGGISKAEFADKLGAGGTNVAAADSVFGKLDSDGDGSVTLKELSAALTRPKKDKDEADKTGTDPLLKAIEDAAASAKANAETSMSSTLAASSASATSSYNFIEQMIQRQAQAISASTTANSSLSIKA